MLNAHTIILCENGTKLSMDYAYEHNNVDYLLLKIDALD